MAYCQSLSLVTAYVPLVVISFVFGWVGFLQRTGVVTKRAFRADSYSDRDFIKTTVVTPYVPLNLLSFVLRWVPPATNGGGGGGVTGRRITDYCWAVTCGMPYSRRLPSERRGSSRLL